MPKLFETTVSAICYEIGRSHNSGAGPENTGPPYNDVTAFVLAQWSRMPRFWALPIGIATLVFSLEGFFFRGRLFHQLTSSQRNILIESWRHSRLGPRRDFIRFYRSLAIMALYSREDEAK